MVRLITCRDGEKVAKLLASLGYAVPMRCDLRCTAGQGKLSARADNLPCAIGQERPEPCPPAPGGQPCLYAVVLKPRGQPGGWELALDAAWLLEERGIAELHWAWALRRTGAVWLLICPWAVKRGRRRRYWPGTGDLDVLREELGARWDRPGEGRN